MVSLFKKYEFDGIVHLAAESHVDRSLSNPAEFAFTISSALSICCGPLMAHGTETLRARNSTIFLPTKYMAPQRKVDFLLSKLKLILNLLTQPSKASSDHFVAAFNNSYGLPTVISRCSNNYGPNHFPEKLIPLMINNIINNKPLPVYGKGENIRDWLYVEDHASAIDTIFHKGQSGEVYNIGGNNEWKNIDLVHLLCTIMDQKLSRAKGTSAKLITYVKTALVTTSATRLMPLN